MIARFSLYDFIAVVMPGIFFLWALSTFLGVSVAGGLPPGTGDLTETSVLIVVGYVVGLLLQGLSQKFTEAALLSWWGGFPSARWLLPGDKRFTASYLQELAAALSTSFGIELPKGPVDSTTRPELMKRAQEIFYRCYRSVEGASELPLTFNAQYGLFRILLTTFVLLGFGALVRVVEGYVLSRDVDYASLGFFIACLAGALISHWRVTKRAEDFARAVYDIFLAQSGKAATPSKGSA